MPKGRLQRTTRTRDFRQSHPQLLDRGSNQARQDGVTAPASTSATPMLDAATDEVGPALPAWPEAPAQEERLSDEQWAAALTAPLPVQGGAQGRGFESSPLNPKFLASLRDDDLVTEYAAHQRSATGALNAPEREKKLGSSKNPLLDVTRGDDHFFAKTLDAGATVTDEAGLQREVMMPLMARSLGLDTLAISARVKGPGGETYAANREAGKSGQDIIKQGDQKGLKQMIDTPTQQVQDTLLADILFQDSDAHSGQYLFGDQGLTKIDNEDLGGDSGAHLSGGKDHWAAAGSFAAALPGARDELTPETLEKIKSWDPEHLAEMMQSATFEKQEGGTARAFSKRAQGRIEGNMALIKTLASGAEGGLTGEELLRQFNAAKYNDAQEKAPGDVVTEHPQMAALEGLTWDPKRDDQFADFAAAHEGEKAFNGASKYEDFGRYGGSDSDGVGSIGLVTASETAQSSYKTLDEASTARAKDNKALQARKAGGNGFEQREMQRALKNKMFKAGDVSSRDQGNRADAYRARRARADRKNRGFFGGWGKKKREKKLARDFPEFHRQRR